MERNVDSIWRRVFITLFAVEVLVVVVLAITGANAGRESERARAVNRFLVGELQLTDLALWSGASYSRHPSQADYFAPHGDHPAALEHYPAGSCVPPPPAGDEWSQHGISEP